MERQVYFIRAIGGFGPVKIGCSQHPPTRLHSLMTWAPYKLEIAAQTPGNFHTERQFHHLFRDTHSHREWFNPSALMERTIEAINTGTFDAATLPEPRGLKTCGRGPWSQIQREALSIRARLRCATEKHGISEPEEIAAAAKRYEDLAVSEREALLQAVEEYLADPMKRGEVMPYKHRVATHAAWLAKQGRAA